MKETKLDLQKIVAARLVAIGFGKLPSGAVDHLVANCAAKVEKTIDAAVTPGAVTKAFVAYSAQVKARPAPVAAASGKPAAASPAR
jgi:hypothetical protein